MENYISYTSVNIQAHPCFVTLHILAEKKNTLLETGVVWSTTYDSAKCQLMTLSMTPAISQYGVIQRDLF